MNYVCLFHIYPPITGNIYKGSIHFQSACVSGVSVYHYWDVLVAVKEETKATYGKVVVDNHETGSHIELKVTMEVLDLPDLWLLFIKDGPFQNTKNVLKSS